MLKQYWARIQEWIDRPWYFGVLAFLAALDLFILIVPVDGLTVSACATKTKRWFWFCLALALGSIAGCVVLFYLVTYSPLVSEHFLESFSTSEGWVRSVDLLQTYGVGMVFFIAASPFPLTPAVALAAVSEMPFSDFLGAVSAGRVIKIFLVGWIASHMPKLLGRLWGIQDEIGLVDQTKTIPHSHKKSKNIQSK